VSYLSQLFTFSFLLSYRKSYLRMWHESLFGPV